MCFDGVENGVRCQRFKALQVVSTLTLSPRRLPTLRVALPHGVHMLRRDGFALGIGNAKDAEGRNHGHAQVHQP